MPFEVVMPSRGGGRLRTAKQGRQDSNLQPPVLETGALPIELRPSVRDHGLYSGLFGHHLRMTDQEYEEQVAPDEEEGDDDPLEEQEGKGYGEDEGEREEALPADH